MTTKTGEKLRGRKRDPDVLAKAWATRRKKAAAKKRAAKKTGSTKHIPKAMVQQRDKMQARSEARKPKASTGPQATHSHFEMQHERHPLDEQLIKEFVEGCMLTKDAMAKASPEERAKAQSWGACPWSQLDAILRHFGAIF